MFFSSSPSSVDLCFLFRPLPTGLRFMLSSFLILELLMAGTGSSQGVSIGRCTFKSPRPSSGTLIRGDVNIIGDVRQTGTRGGVSAWKGDGDVWVIYKSAREVGKHDFEVSGKVQICRDF